MVVVIFIAPGDRQSFQQWQGSPLPPATGSAGTGSALYLFAVEILKQKEPIYQIM